MRTRVIPAQITTVEDKIAGNLNLTQILLLMAPVFAITLIYGILPPKMHLAMYKVPLALVILLVSLILAIRIKGKVVIHWLILILRYNIRPRFYFFTKNDLYLRDLDLPVFEKKQRKLFKTTPAKQEISLTRPSLALRDLLSLRGVLDPNYSYSLKSKKGGLYVAFEQVKK